MNIISPSKIYPKGKTMIKKFSKKIANLLAVVFIATSSLSVNVFAADSGNIASKIAQESKGQIEAAGSAVATIINTVAIVMGAIWIIAMLLMAFFNMEALKNNAKMLFGAIVIIGIVYGLSKAYM